MVQKEPPQLLSSVLAREKAAHRLHGVQGLALHIRTEALLCAGVCSRVFLDSESFGCPCFLNVCVAVVLEKDDGSLLQDSGQGMRQSHGVSRYVAKDIEPTAIDSLEVRRGDDTDGIHTRA